MLIGLFNEEYFALSELKIQNISNRSGETEWDQMLNFIKRKAERFIKTMSFELTIPTSETGRNGAYEPRFLDEIADEINTLEDKKDTLFCKYLFKVNMNKIYLKYMFCYEI